jgi:thioredoxin-dependent peroxiredoxin
MSDILKVGERAPEFNLLADDGKQLTLADFRGKNVVLFFFPKALTPG